MRTVLILGAGASKSLNTKFGLGLDLITEIRNRVTDITSPIPGNLSNHLNDIGFDADIRNKYFEHISSYIRRNYYAPSIDAFVDEINNYPEFAGLRDDYIGISKYLVTAHILGYEGESKSTTSSSWVDLIVNHIHKEDLLRKKNDSFKIITFNYDRSLEYFLIQKLNEKGYPSESALQFIEENIFHVYGTISPLTLTPNDNKFTYGENNDKKVKIMAKKDDIKLMFEERLESQSHYGAIHQCLHQDVEKIIATFGFAFDPINCGRLKLQQLVGVDKCQFITNVFPHRDFSIRNRDALKIRTLNHNAEVTYLSANDFFTKVLK